MQKTLKGHLRQGHSCYKQQELLGCAMYSSQNLHESVYDAVSTGRQGDFLRDLSNLLLLVDCIVSKPSYASHCLLCTSSTCFDYISLLADICARRSCSCTLHKAHLLHHNFIWCACSEIWLRHPCMLQPCPSHHYTHVCCKGAGLRIQDSSKNLFMLTDTCTANDYAKVGMLKLLPVSCCGALVNSCTITFLGYHANKCQVATTSEFWCKGCFGSLSEASKM